MFRPNVPEPVPVEAVTVQVVPEPLTPVMVSPVKLLVPSTNEKLLLVTPVTEPEKVTVQLTFAELQTGLLLARLIEETVTPGGVPFNSYAPDISSIRPRKSPLVQSRRSRARQPGRHSIYGWAAGLQGHGLSWAAIAGQRVHHSTERAACRPNQIIIDPVGQVRAVDDTGIVPNDVVEPGHGARGCS